FGQPEIAWFRRALTGDKSLSRAVLANVNLDAGSVYGFLPSNEADLDLTHFEGNVFGALLRSDVDQIATAAADASIDLARSLGGNVFASQLDFRRPNFHAGMTWGEGVPLVPERIAFHRDEVFTWRRLDE